MDYDPIFVATATGAKVHSTFKGFTQTFCGARTPSLVIAPEDVQADRMCRSCHRNPEAALANRKADA